MCPSVSRDRVTTVYGTISVNLLSNKMWIRYCLHILYEINLYAQNCLLCLCIRSHLYVSQAGSGYVDTCMLIWKSEKVFLPYSLFKKKINQSINEKMTIFIIALCISKTWLSTIILTWIYLLNMHCISIYLQ